MKLERWESLMEVFEFKSNHDTYHSLINAYSEKHRYYHTSEHITAILNHLDKTNNNTKEIELALWFHDAIYKIFSSTNELDSANWSTDFLTRNSTPRATIEKVHQLIMATVHSNQVYKGEKALMIDVDLSILGASDTVFLKYEEDIRLEYKIIPYFIYKKKRKEILKSFINRDRIYQTPYFFDKFEVQARTNINRSIST